MPGGPPSVLMWPTIVIGGVIALASLAAILTYGVPGSAPAASAEDSAFREQPSPEGGATTVEPPEDTPVVTALANLRLVQADDDAVVPLSTWVDSIGSTWDAGEHICIVGPAPCYQQSAVSAIYLEQPGSSVRIY